MDLNTYLYTYTLDVLTYFDENHDVNYDLFNKELPKVEALKIEKSFRDIFRNRSYLDFIINKMSVLNTKDMRSVLRNIIRIGVYEILIKNRSDNAVEEAIINSKQKLDSNMANLVSAILNNINRKKKELPPPVGKDRNDTISIWLSHPDWLVTKWVKRYGEENAIKLMQVNNMPSTHTLRVNTMRTSNENFLLRLQKTSIKHQESPWLKGYYNVDGLDIVIRKNWLLKGLCQVQDVGEAYGAVVLQPKEGDNVYQVCIHEGNQAIQIAQMIGEKGTVHAIDDSVTHLGQLSSRALICQCENITINRQDILSLNIPKADAILLVPPSSNLGRLRDYPELKWKLSPEKFAEITQLQAKILAHVSQFLNPNGKLVYTVCSMEPEETVDQIKHFLNEHPKFKIESLKGVLPNEVLDKDHKYYQTLPHIHNTHGYYGVCMRYQP